GQHHFRPEERRSGSVNWFWHLLCIAEKGPQRTQSADGRHHQDRCPQSRKVFRRGRTQESRQPHQVGPTSTVKTAGVSPAVSCFVHLRGTQPEPNSASS